MGMRSHSYLSRGPHAFHRIAFTDWGSSENERIAICVHGLTRNGRDFDYLAAALEDEYRVVCPDIVGRGYSEWLAVKEDYSYPTYCTDMASLVAWLHADRVDWVGTSMGGLIGMLLAALPNTPIQRLVVNDVGPLIPAAALERLGAYVGSDPRFDDVEAVEQYSREIYAPFGPLGDAQWRHFARHGVRQCEDGRYGLAYDPGISVNIESENYEDVDLWAVWDAIRCPVLVLRGAESDLLTAETVEEMRGRGPRTDVVEFPGIGHAPALMESDQIDIVRDWLLAAD